MKQSRQPCPGRCPACNGHSLYRRGKSPLIFCSVCKGSGFTEAEVALYQSQQRGLCRYKNAGLAARIRLLLRSGPLTIPQLMSRLGVGKSSILASLKQTMSTQGGIVKTGDRKHEAYALYVPRREQAANSDAELIRIAQTITVGRGSYWGAGLA